MQAFVSALHPKHVVIGFNYSFGKMGAGKAADMRRFGEQYGFETHVVDEVQIGGLPVSSTRVRAAVAQGNMEEAARLLGRPYAICGVIQRGKQLGSRLDFPDRRTCFGPRKRRFRRKAFTRRAPMSMKHGILRR